MEASSISGSAKRAKAPGNLTQVAHCLVDGCDADLSLCRDYHRRHKVCEMHSKTAKVTIGGREQRFCQQCSRFHSLVEFDEGKRSCRKRLDGHNRRRRKQPDALPRNSGLVFSSQQSATTGTRLLSFASPQMLPTSAVMGSSWAGIVKAESDIVMYNNPLQLNYIERQNMFPECSAQSYKGVSQLQFAPGGFQEPSMCQPLLDPNAVPESSSDRALSLLSSAPTATREFALSHGVQAEPQAQPLVQNPRYDDLGRYPFLQESKPMGSSTDSRDTCTLHFPDMFQQAPEGSSTSGSHQTLTFTWE